MDKVLRASDNGGLEPFSKGPRRVKGEGQSTLLASGAGGGLEPFCEVPGRETVRLVFLHPGLEASEPFCEVPRRETVRHLVPHWAPWGLKS